jgi:PAS domain S-box-containing protein
LAAAFLLLVLALGNRLGATDVSVAALAVVLVLLGFTAFLSVHAWHLGRRDIYATECQFESVYRHALDAILILDDRGTCLDANPAAVALLGAHPVTIVGHSFATFYEDPARFERQWGMFLDCRYQRGHTELLRTDGSKVCVLYTISTYLQGHNVLILCDVTERVRAEAQIAEHMAATEAARAEAEALRKATLALTQNLRMDAVLDALLETVRQIIPYEMASVILTEEDGRLFVARETPAPGSNRPIVTLEAGQNPLLQQVTRLREGVHLDDTRAEGDWREGQPFVGIRVAVPLVVSDTVLGLLSIGSVNSGSFGDEHFRMAKSLAIPAAVAIHNARLYEWAQIYATERRALLRNADDSRNVGEVGPSRSKKRFTN